MDYMICKPIAELIPAQSATSATAAVNELLSFMQAQQRIAEMDLRALIDAGRA